MMIQVPSTDGKNTKANLSKYLLSRQFFPPGAIQSIQQNRHNKNADFLLVFIRLPEKRSDRYPSHMHIQRGTEKIPVNFFFYALLKYALHSITETGCIRSTSALFVVLLPFRFPAVSHPRFPDLPDGSIPARTLQLAAMPRLTPLDELPSRRFCALKFSFLSDFE